MEKYSLFSSQVPERNSPAHVRESESLEASIPDVRDCGKTSKNLVYSLSVCSLNTIAVAFLIAFIPEVCDWRKTGKSRKNRLQPSYFQICSFSHCAGKPISFVSTRGC